jgi:hypothetical protein
MVVANGWKEEREASRNVVTSSTNGFCGDLRRTSNFRRKEIHNLYKELTRLFRSALDVAWRYAEGLPVNYESDVKKTHLALAAAAPDLDDANSDEVLLYVVSAIARALIILERPEKSAMASVSSAGCMASLVGLVYEDHAAVEAAEATWQEQALDLLESQTSYKRGFAAAIPEYPRGEVYKVFRKS